MLIDLTERDAALLRRVLDAFQQTAPEALASMRPPPVKNVVVTHKEFVQLTSATPSDGRYHGQVYRYDPEAKTWTAGELCWVVDSLGATLTTGEKYEGRRAAGYAGSPSRLVFITDRDGPIHANVSVAELGAHIVSGDGNTMTASANGALGSLDNVTPYAGLSVLYRPKSSEDGVWLVSDVGSAGTPWVLTRLIPAGSRIAVGSFVVVEDGFSYGSTVWVTEKGPTATVGGHSWNLILQTSPNRLESGYPAAAEMQYDEVRGPWPNATNNNTLTWYYADGTHSNFCKYELPTFSGLAADRIPFFDFSAGAVVWLTVGTGLTITGTTITASGSGYTDEEAQDAVGGILTDSATIDFTYDDGANTITGDVKDASVTFAKMQAVSTNILLGNDASGTTVEEITCTAFARTILDDADAATARTTLGAQTSDATLTAFAALTIAANSLTIGTGADAFSQTTFAANRFPARASTGNLEAKTISDFALTILDDADAATVRATIGAGTGGGDVVGPGSSTDNALARFDATTGKLLQNSTVTLNDAGEFSALAVVDSSTMAYSLYLQSASTTPLTAARAITFDVKNADRQIALGGNVMFAGGVTTSGGDFTFTTAAGSSVTVPASGTLATLAGTETLTNKSIDAGQLTGTIAAARLPAASDTAQGALEVAVQSEMESASSTTLAVTPGRVNYHPGVAKAWVLFEADGTLSTLASHGVSSVTDNGTGDHTVNLSTSFSSTSYAAVGTASQSVDATANCIVVENTLGGSRAAGTFPLYVLASNGTLKDASFISVAFFGDQ